MPRTRTTTPDVEADLRERAPKVLRACAGLPVREALALLAHVSASLVVAPAIGQDQAEACGKAYVGAFRENIRNQITARFGRVQ